MKTTGYFVRTLCGVAFAMVLVAVSPAQTTPAGTQNTAGPFGFNCGASKQAITRQEDFLKPGSVWAGQDEWTLSYMKKERTLASHWVFTPPNHCVTSIDLTAEAANQTTGAVLIEFEFTGYVPPPEDLSKKNVALDKSR